MAREMEDDCCRQMAGDGNIDPCRMIQAHSTDTYIFFRDEALRKEFTFPHHSETADGNFYE